MIGDLPMATSAELYQLSWVIEQLLAEPRRIVQVRAHLHTGQQVRYLHWTNGKLYPARAVGMHGDHAALQDGDRAKPFKVHYAASLTDLGDAASSASGEAPADVDSSSNKPAPPPGTRLSRRLKHRQPRHLHRQATPTARGPDRAHQPAHRHA